MPVPKPSIIDTPLSEWPKLIASMGESAYRAGQLNEWIFQKRAIEFSDMTTLPAPFREKLSDQFIVHSLQMIRREDSKQDGTARYFFRTDDGQIFSCVYLPFQDRASLCISTQVGCAWGCVFCASGKVPYERNLTISEILSQIMIVEKDRGRPLDSLLFMGMGEPLANYNNLIASLHIIRAKTGLNFGARHVTVSTCGLAPQIEKMADDAPKINLAISLHAAQDELRSALLPKSSKWSIKELLKATKNFSKKTGSRVTFEYILLNGVNDSEVEAKRLSNLLRGFVKYGDYYVNLIAYNPVPGLPFEKPKEENLARFKSVLTARGIQVHLRKPQGVDISAGCGQLGEAIRG